MRERIQSGARRRTFEYSSDVAAQLPSRTPERNVPLRHAPPTREELIRAAQHRTGALAPVAKQRSPSRVAEFGKEVAAGTVEGTITVLGVAAKGSVMAGWGFHTVMSRAADFIAQPIVNGLLSLQSTLSPLSWVWNKILGKKGGAPTKSAPAPGHH